MSDKEEGKLVDIREKIDELIRQMTLEEKASLCSGQGPWHTQALERLGIPALTLTDGPHGVRLSVKPEEFGVWEHHPATCFPTNSAMAASWDTELVREVGKALAEECKALGVHVLLGPGINMKRSPLCGRNFEYYSEDPVLAGEMATAFVQGVQERGVGTSVKHYACNNQEFERMSINAEVDERTLREIYLPAFERVVKKAQPWTIMCAYNRINGVYGSEHRYLLTDILRDEWGFDGIVVSDWGAVNDRVAGLKAGLDLQMPGPAPRDDEKIVQAVRSGELDERVLDETVRRLLELVFKATGAVQEKDGKENRVEVDFAAHHQLARRAAAECMVLLKNDGNLLPLDAAALTSLAVIGRTAVEPRFQGGGSSQINPTQVDIPLEEIKKLAPNVTVTYAEGYPDSDEIDAKLIDEAVSAARQADVAVLFIGLPDRIESEGYDRKNMDLPENQVRLVQAVAAVQSNVVVVLNNGSAITMKPWIDQVPAVLEAWLPGQAGGGAIADILFGKVNPSGKLSETFPEKLADNPSYLNFPGENGVVRYGEGLFIGYRYYDKKQIRPLFPFGYGLSYTEFEYSDLKLDRTKMKDTEQLTVTVTVKNIGDRAGKEVVQLYINPKQSRLIRPDKELKGFAKVALEPGEAKEVTFTLSARDFAYYDPSYKTWVVETGEYEILIAKSAADIALKAVVRVESTQELRKPLTKDTSLKDWIADERGLAVLKSVIPEAMLQPFTQVDSALADMFLAIPLRKLVNFSGGMLTDEILDQIVAKANE